jgi:hypothetical protein
MRGKKGRDGMRQISKSSAVKYFALMVLILGGVIGVRAQAPAAGAPAGQARPEGQGRGGANGAARAPAPVRPPLFFRETWKQTPAGGEHPIGQEDVASANLVLKVYGADAKDMQETGVEGTPNPVHMWTGICTSACAATLSDKDNYVDLTGLARIRWNVKIDGFHMLRPIIKLADGTWLVGDHADAYATDWYWSEFGLADVRWRKFDSAKVIATGEWVPNVDLSKVDEIGFTDLMPGGGHGTSGWSDVADFEVYGKPVPRSATVSKNN